MALILQTWESMAKVHFVGCILLIMYDVGDSMLQQTERAPADLSHCYSWKVCFKEGKKL